MSTCSLAKKETRKNVEKRKKEIHVYIYIPAERKRENEQSKVGYINELACG